MQSPDESEPREEHGGEADVLVADSDRGHHKIEDYVESQQSPEHQTYDHNLVCSACKGDNPLSAVLASQSFPLFCTQPMLGTSKNFML